MKVELVRRARREILDLDFRLADAVAEALGLLERVPEAGYELRGRLRALRSLRLGTYRVIYQTDGQKKVLRVVTVRHRSVAYRTDPR